MTLFHFTEFTVVATKQMCSVWTLFGMFALLRTLGAQQDINAELYAHRYYDMHDDVIANTLKIFTPTADRVSQTHLEHIAWRDIVNTLSIKHKSK